MPFWFIFIIWSVSYLCDICSSVLTSYRAVCMWLQSSGATSFTIHINTSHADIAAAWSGQLVYDFAVFLLTLVRSLQIRRERSRSITQILLRDDMHFEFALLLQPTSLTLGTMYFACVENWWMSIADEIPSFQSNVCSQRCKYICVIGELSRHVPPYFPKYIPG